MNSVFLFLVYGYLFAASIIIRRLGWHYERSYEKYLFSERIDNPNLKA